MTIYRLQNFLKESKYDTLTDTQYNDILNNSIDTTMTDDNLLSAIFKTIQLIMAEEKLASDQKFNKVVHKYLGYKTMNTPESLKQFLTAFRGYAFIIYQPHQDVISQETRRKIVLLTNALFFAGGKSCNMSALDIHQMFNKLRDLFNIDIVTFLDYYEAEGKKLIAEASTLLGIEVTTQLVNITVDVDSYFSTLNEDTSN